MLKDTGSDLKACEGHNIKNFFEQCGLKSAFDFDKAVTKHTQKDVNASEYEKLTHDQLF